MATELTNPISGTQGRVVIATSVLAYDAAADYAIGLITRFNADFRRDVSPNDTFETADNVKRKIGGMYDIAGTCEGWLDAEQPFLLDNFVLADYVPDETVVTGDLIELVVRRGATTNLSYEFPAILSNINIQVVKSSELNRFSLTFESSGAIAVLPYV